MILPILIYPNSKLRLKSKEVIRLDKKIKKFIKNLTETMENNKGLGLAAPQVGELLRIIVIATTAGSLSLINPKIIKKSWTKEKAQEGCLSVPEIFAEVLRAKDIKVEALNQKGQRLQFKAQGLFARVIQHEIDHLDGILFIDKTQKTFKEKKYNDNKSQRE